METLEDVQTKQEAGRCRISFMELQSCVVIRCLIGSAFVLESISKILINAGLKFHNFLRLTLEASVFGLPRLPSPVCNYDK